MAIAANRNKVLFLPVIRGFYNRDMTKAAKAAVRNACAELAIDAIFPDDSGCTEGLINGDSDVRAYFDAWRADLADLKALVVFSADFMRERAVQDTVRLLPPDVPVFLVVNNDDPVAMRQGVFGDALCGSFSVVHNLRMLGRELTAGARIDMSDAGCLREVIAEFARIADGIESLRNMRIGMLGVNPVEFATTFTNQMKLFELGFSLHPYELLDMWGDTVLGARLESGASVYEGDFGCVKLRQPITKNDPAVAHFRRQLAETLPRLPDDERKPDMTARCLAWVQRTFERDGIDAGAVHCWPEFEQYFGVRPCSFSMLANELLGKPVVCELDICHAAMARLAWAVTGRAGVILDINNNGWDPRVFNVFHCSQTPVSWLRDGVSMTPNGEIQGVMAPAPFTAVAAATSAAAFHATVFSGHFLRDDPGLRGSSGWAFVPNLPEVMQAMEHRSIHHFVAMHGHVGREVTRALRFRGLDVVDLAAAPLDLDQIEADLPPMPTEQGASCSVFSR
ncbi:MAG: hypothetical protein GXP31_19420 [Kiritimatiellaeota bacterium]|nr:hypothetical protein [Kiritimatiellota bacterium]